jgi:hypothetical protein
MAQCRSDDPSASAVVEASSRWQAWIAKAAPENNTLLDTQMSDDARSLWVVARSFKTAQWRRLVQFPAGSRQGQNILCLSYRVERGEANKESRRASSKVLS